MTERGQGRIDWDALERRVPLDALPELHRALLARHEPGEDWRAAPLRRVQGKVAALLKRLEREGRVETGPDGRLRIDRDALPAEAGPWLDDTPGDPSEGPPGDPSDGGGTA